MKISFVGSGSDGCYIYRCYNPGQKSKYDVVGDYDVLNGKFEPNNTILESDIVIFHRPFDEQRLTLMKQLKLRGIVVGYDNDDTWTLPDNHRVKKHFDKAGVDENDIVEKNEEFIEEADFVTTTTKFLAEEYRKVNKNTYILPNLINYDLYGDGVKNNTDKVKILLTGSVLWGDDSNHILEVLDELDKRDDVQLVLFGEKVDRFKNAEQIGRVSAIDYYKKIGQLGVDICLIPRADNYFNRCKSNCKYLEMSAYGIPVIAQSFDTHDSPYDITAQEGSPIIIANSIDEWRYEVNRLIDNKQEREHIGKSAQEIVKKKYNADANTFDEIIDKIIKQYDL